MSVLLAALPALVVDCEGGSSVPILGHLVDRVPYNSFQLFRGPYACKLSGGRLVRETCLEPDSFFRNDPLTLFVGHVNPDNALQLLPVHELLSRNEELREHHTQHLQRMESVARSRGAEYVSPQDQANLYIR